MGFIQIVVTLIFLSLFIYKSITLMNNVPFYDFDEAHRAENAKRMLEYKSFIVPLTGSSFDRVLDLKIPMKDNPDIFLYYHLERPTFIYWLMIFSTYLFGQSELSFRLPSFFLGLATIISLIFLSIKIKPLNSYFPLLFAFLSLVTAGCLWLSAQYAQLDTGLTFFLFLSLSFLILYCQQKRTGILLLAGISWALAVLSKGQPSIIIIFPLIYLMLIRKIMLLEVVKFFAFAGILLLPWITLLTLHFGFLNVVKIFSGFAISSAITEYLHHKAPFFWYVRWWFEDFRPGAVLFFVLFLYDFYHKKFDWKKLTLLSYIFGSLIIYSIPVNKIWWYVLPLVPAIAFYIYLSVSEKTSKIFNLSIIVILASLPIFLKVANTISMFYGIILITASILILQLKINKNITKLSPYLFVTALTLSLYFFWLNFPQITPYHRGTKAVAQHYASLPGKKCLWTGDMPQESVLFYSNAGGVRPLNDITEILPGCTNYLITPGEVNLDGFKLIFQDQDIKLYELNN